MKQIKKILDKLYDDVFNNCIEGDSISEIGNYIRKNSSYKSLVLYVKNSPKSSRYLRDLFSEIIGGEVYELSEEYDVDEDSVLGTDLILVAILSVFIDAGLVVDAEVLSRIASDDQSLFWARAVATAYLLNREVEKHDPIRIAT